MFVKSEIVRVTFLTILLVLGIIHLSRDGLQKQTFMSNLTGKNLIADLTMLRRQLVGQQMPVITVREAVTKRQNTASPNSRGMLILIPANACMQQQIGVLRRFQELHEALGDQIATRLVLLSNDHGGVASRYKSLLLRKAIRPDFDIWYTEGMTSFAKTILDKQFGLVLLIKDHKVTDIFHIEDHGNILRGVSGSETFLSAG